MTHLSLNSLTETRHGHGHSTGLGVGKLTRNSFLLHPAGMEHLSQVLPRLEEADLSGQCEIGLDGWSFFIKSMEHLQEQGLNVNLRKLTLRCCRLKETTKSVLQDSVCKYQPNLEIDFGQELDNGHLKDGSSSCLKEVVCCSNGEE